MSAPRVTGLILAGGRGTRMDAVDKGLQALRGRPLVEHAIGRLAPQVDALVISANRHRDVYAAYGRPVVADLIEDAGPLGGVHAALAVCDGGLLAVVPCDAPDFPSDLVARLRVPLSDPAVEAASVATAERAHPVFCLLRTTVAPALLDYLKSGRRSMHGWIASLANRPVSFADEDAFRNLNTRADLQDRGRRA